MSIKMIGLDLAKGMFQVHGVDEHGKVFLRKLVARLLLAVFFATCRPAWSAWRPLVVLKFWCGSWPAAPDG